MIATPAWPPRSAPRLFIEQEILAGQCITIDGKQAHYLTRVMRAAQGDSVILCDNVTGEWAARILSASRRDVMLEPISLLRGRENVPDFTLYAALLKKDRFDMLLEKATELGVRSIQPVLTRRCVADKLNLERARAIIIEAAEQCARTALPDLAAPAKLETIVKNWPTDRTLFFADETGGNVAMAEFSVHPGPAGLLIGPEGGFDSAEREMIRAQAQSRPITLGPRILRGETAAIAATALWMGVSGQWAND